MVSPAGTGLDAFWEGLRTVPADARERRVDDFDPSPWLSGKDARHHDRFTQFAVAAAEMALAHAGGAPDVDPARAGVHLGTGIGGVGTLETQVGVLTARGPGRVSPFTIPMVMPNAGAAAVALRQGWRGPCETLTTACAAGTHSIAAGARMVFDGRCDAVLAGGAESSMTPTTVAGVHHHDGAVAHRAVPPVRPGPRRVLHLRGRGRAAARGARGGPGPRRHRVRRGARRGLHLRRPPHDRAAARWPRRRRLHAARAGRRRARPGDVRHVNAHGTSTPLNDAAEAQAVATVFGPHAVPVTSIKGVTGHGLGAAGALEAASVLLSFLHRELPPTMGTTEVDPALEVDVVLEPRAWEPGPGRQQLVRLRRPQRLARARARMTRRPCSTTSPWRTSSPTPPTRTRCRASGRSTCGCRPSPT